MTEHKWTKVVANVPADGHYCTYRLKVPGGWLYRVGTEPPHHLTFVPEPEIKFKAGSGGGLLPVMAAMPELRRTPPASHPYRKDIIDAEFSEGGSDE